MVQAGDVSEIDRDRFNLDLSEILDEAEEIASLTNTQATASALLQTLSVRMAHLSSHWERLARDTDQWDVYVELIKTARSSNDDDLSWWQRLRRGHQGRI